jgi:hypothetical protein
MRIRNINTKITTVFALAALVGAGTIWEVRHVRAAQTPPLKAARFAMMGIVRGQSVRINASNITVPDPNLPPDPCRARLSFVDEDGNVLTNPRTGEAEQRTIILQSGKSAFLHLNADDFLGLDTNGSGRVQLRAVFTAQTLQDGNGQVPPDPCTPELEVIDNATSKTSFVYAGTPALQLPGLDQERQ